MGDDERRRREADHGVAQGERERDPRGEPGPAGRVDGQHRADARDQHEPGGRREGGRVHSNTTQRSPAMSQTLGSSKNEL